MRKLQWIEDNIDKLPVNAFVLFYINPFFLVLTTNDHGVSTEIFSNTLSEYIFKGL